MNINVFAFYFYAFYYGTTPPDAVGGA